MSKVNTALCLLALLITFSQVGCASNSKQSQSNPASNPKTRKLGLCEATLKVSATDNEIKEILATGILPSEKSRHSVEVVFNKLQPRALPNGEAKSYRDIILEQLSIDKHRKNFNRLSQVQRTSLESEVDSPYDNFYILPVQSLNKRLLVLEKIDRGGFTQYLNDNYEQLHSYLETIQDCAMQARVMQALLYWSILHEGYHLNNSKDTWRVDEAKAEIRSTLLFLIRTYNEVGLNNQGQQTEYLKLILGSIEAASKSELSDNEDYQLNKLGARAKLVLLGVPAETIMALDTDREILDFSDRIFKITPADSSRTNDDPTVLKKIFLRFQS